MMAMCRCVLWHTSRTLRIIVRVHVSFAWAMLSLQTSTPAMMRRSSIFSSSVAGPIVKMIFVRR